MADQPKATKFVFDSYHFLCKKASLCIGWSLRIEADAFTDMNFFQDCRNGYALRENVD